MTHETPLASRRTVIKTAAWATPAISLAAAAPAFASSEENPTLSTNVFGTLYSRSGVAGVRVTVRSSTGRPLAGRMLTASLPSEGEVSFVGGGHSRTFGPTGTDGVAIIPAIQSPSGLADNNSLTTRTLTVSLVVPATTSSPTRQVTTSFTIQPRGRAVIINATATSQRQMISTYPPRVVGPWYAQALGASTYNLHYLGSFSGTMSDSNKTAGFTYAAIADPVLVGGESLVTYTSDSGATTVTQSSSTDRTLVGSSPEGVGLTTLHGPGAYSISGELHVADPSLGGTPLHLVDYPDKVASRRTTSGRRTVSWTMTSDGGHYWRSSSTGTGSFHQVPDVPARSTPVGEDVFLTPNKDRLIRGTQSHSPGVSIDSAYAAVVGDDEVATVWFTLSGSNNHFEWRPDGTITHVTPASVSGDPGSMVASGYGYFRRGSLHYFNGQEIFWGSAQPYVTATSTGLYGTN